MTLQKNPRRRVRRPVGLRASLLGLSGISVLAAITFAAALAYRGKQGEVFSPLNHFVSELGQGGVSRLAPLFNVGMAAGGLLLAAFMNDMGRRFGGRDGRAARMAGTVAGLSCSLLGVVTMNRFPPHFAAALVFFASFFIAILIFTRSFRAGGLGGGSRWLAWPGALAITAFIACLILIVSTGRSYKQILGPSSAPRPDIWPLPLAEWCVFLAVLIWVLAVSLESLRVAFLVHRGTAPPTEREVVT